MPITAILISFSDAIAALVMARLAGEVVSIRSSTC